MNLHIQGLPMLVRRLIVCSLLFAFLIFCPAMADDFPGKGDRSAWSDALPYYNLANKYLSHDRIDEAVQNYEEAIYRYEYDPDFYLNYGVALRKRENYSGAETAFKKAIELKSSDWQAWSNLANAYLKQNRLKDTIASFQKAMKCVPAPPQSEKEAMLKDISDINKILSMQEPPKTAAKVQSGTVIRKSVKTGSGAGTRAVAARESIQNSKSSVTGNTSQAVSSVEEKTDLKKSGWDWVK